MLSIVFLSLQLFNKPKIKVYRSIDEPFCKLCMSELKENFYKDYEYEKYLKSTSWVETVNKRKKFLAMEYDVTLKQPEFKFKNGLYYDKNLEIFFHPTTEELPTLIFDASLLRSDNFNEALLIKASMNGLEQIEYSKFSGWTIYLNTLVIRLGKNEIEERLIKLNIILSDFEKNNLKNKILDLRYQNGFSVRRI